MTEESDCGCVMRRSGNCKGIVIRLHIGTDFVDVCVRHCVLLKEVLTAEGF